MYHFVPETDPFLHLPKFNDAPMKHFNPHYKITLAMLFSFLVISCAKEDDLSPTNPDAADINSYIRGLNYDPTALLNVQETGGASSKRTLQDSTNTTSQRERGTGAHRFVQPALQYAGGRDCRILCLPSGHLGVTNAPHGLG